MNQEILTNPISKEYVNSLPVIKYNGKIEVIDSPAKLDRSISSIKSEKIFGFDTETRPAFKKGQSYPVSLIQIALHDIVYIIQIKKSGFQQSLVDFLEDHAKIKAGIALHDDIVKLKKSRAFEPGGFTDLSRLASQKEIIQTGLQALTARYMGQRITKGAQTSNWSRKILMENQKIYAATDAWLCLQIYPKLLADDNDYYVEEE